MNRRRRFVAAVLAAVACAGGLVAVATAQFAPSTPVVPATAPAGASTRPTTQVAARRPKMSDAERRKLIGELVAAYGLQDGQDVRMVFPPFPAVRSVMLGKDAKRVTCLMVDLLQPLADPVRHRFAR